MMTDTTTQTQEDTMASGRAMDVFGLETLSSSTKEGRILISDGEARFWVDAIALEEEVEKCTPNTCAEADAYSEWCRGANADSAS
jgi:hypothetical protein